MTHPTIRLPRIPFVAAFVIVSTFAALAVGPARADAAARWRATTLTFRDTTPWGGSVDRAVGWINAMPGPITLRRARAGRPANITLVSVDRSDVSWAGLAWVSYADWSYRIAKATVRLNADWFGGDGATMPTARAEVAAHELLHAIGLPHAWGCSIMRPSGGSLPEVCPGVADGELRCGPQRADAKAVVARYGGRVRDWDGFRCVDDSYDEDEDWGDGEDACPVDVAVTCDEDFGVRSRGLDRATPRLR